MVFSKRWLVVAVSRMHMSCLAFSGMIRLFVMAARKLSAKTYLLFRGAENYVRASHLFCQWYIHDMPKDSPKKPDFFGVFVG